MLKTLLLSVLFLSLHAKVYEMPDLVVDYERAKQECSKKADGPWRLLNIQELYSLKGKTDFFSKNEKFWALNTFQDGPLQEDKKGYSFYLENGDINAVRLRKHLAVICTDNPTPSFKRNLKKGPYGVIDNDLKIIWMSLDAHNKKKRYKYEQAIELCEEQTYLKRTWRLAKLDELYSIVDYSQTRPAVNTHIFGEMMKRYYWSSDTFNNDKSYAVGFKFGSIAASSNRNRSYVRCVSDIE